MTGLPARCHCSAPWHVEDGLAVCAGGHVLALASALDRLAAWPGFAEQVRARLELGRAAYQDRSFARPAAELAREIEAELLDTAAWSFIPWTRVRRLRDELARLEAAGPSGGGDGAA